MTNEETKAVIRGLQLRTYIVNVALSVLAVLGIGFIAYIGYMSWRNYLDGPSSLVENTHIRDQPPNPVFAPGDTFFVAFTATRFHDCDLDVRRYIRRTDGPTGETIDALIDERDQSFIGDKKPFASGYPITLPETMQSGQYIAFSLSRYHCNLLDDVLKRMYYAAEVPFRVERPRPEPASPASPEPRPGQ
jgi:hypothetical protein